MADQREGQRRRGGGGPPRKRAPRRHVEVNRVERLAPRMVRVTVGGEGLNGFPSDAGPAAHMKIFVPVEGQEDLVMRTYTVRRFDPSSNELDLEFLVHGDGPASNWASRAAVGDKIQIAGAPRSTYKLNEDADFHVLLGDESALPAMATILDVLPAAANVLVFAEVEGPDDELALNAPENTTIQWLHRGDAKPGQPLIDALKALQMPAGDGEIWVGCEAMAMRVIRKHLLEERGFERDAIRTRGYWQVGEADHSDHDTGE